MSLIQSVVTTETERKLVDEISELTEEISAGKETYQEQTQQTGKYKERRRQLKTIRNNVKNRFDDDVNSIKIQQTNLCSKLANATSGLSHGGTLVESIASDKEKAVEVDTYMSRVLENIAAEIRVCDSKIEDATEQANATKSDVNTKVDVVKSDIAQLKQLSSASGSSLSAAANTLAAPSKIP